VRVAAVIVDGLALLGELGEPHPGGDGWHERLAAWRRQLDALRPRPSDRSPATPGLARARWRAPTPARR
jgi:hypothetical protein